MEDLVYEFKKYFCEKFYEEKKEILSKQFDEKYIESFIDKTTESIINKAIN
jgi:hypothetical protein